MEPDFFEEPAHLPKDAARLAPDALTAPEIERLLDDDADFIKWYLLAAGLARAAQGETPPFEIDPARMLAFVDDGKMMLALESLRRKGVFENLQLPPVETWISDRKGKISMELTEAGKRAIYARKAAKK